MISLKKFKNSDMYNFFFELSNDLQVEEKVLTISEEKLSKFKQIICILNYLGNEECKNVAFTNAIYLHCFASDSELLTCFSKERGYFPISYILNPVDSKRNDLLNIIYSSKQLMYKEGDKILSKNQKKMAYDLLNSDKDKVIISATSSGKSSTILKDIMEHRYSKVLLIVPTKMLVFQFQQLFKEKINHRIITHPDQSYKHDEDTVFIFTQERTINFLDENKGVYFNRVYVDEAQNMLTKDQKGSIRSILLNIVILKLKMTNNDALITYLTPFKVSKKSMVYMDDRYQNLNNYIPTEFNEYDNKMKAERIHVFHSNKIFCFNKFVNDNDLEFNEVGKVNNAISYLAKKNVKSITYLNKPQETIDFARKILKYRKNSDYETKDVICTLTNYFHKDFEIIKFLEKGIFVINGTTPSLIRMYLLQSFNSTNKNLMLVTNSAMLEGINTNATEMNIVSLKKGIKLLTAAETENLIGRINRYNDVFCDNSLKKICSEINFVFDEQITGKTYSNLNTYKSAIKNALKKPTELFNECDIKKDNIDYQDREFLDNNLEINNDDISIAKTHIGKELFKFAYKDIEILEHENKISSRILKSEMINNHKKVLKSIYDIFWDETVSSDNFELNRFKEEKTQTYYTMLLDNRISLKPMKQLVMETLNYWKRIKKSNLSAYGGYVYIGQQYGDCDIDDLKISWRKPYIDINSKTDNELVNYAIYKCLLEYEYFDFKIMPYIELIYKFDKMSDELYNTIKYGTTDESIIELIRIGFRAESIEYFIDNNFFELNEVNLFDLSIKKKLYDTISDDLVKLEVEMLLTVI